MTVQEAKDAVMKNTVLRQERYDVSGYAYKISYVQERGKEPYITVECRSLVGNSAFSARPEDLKIDDEYYNIWEAKI